MEDIIYLKLVQDYEDALNSNKFIFFKKWIFKFKNSFNIVTKKRIGIFNLWVLAYKENIQNNKFERIIKKSFLNKDIKLVLSDKLNKKETLKVLDKYNIKYINGSLAKKKLIFRVLDYINKIQSKKNIQREITVLVNENSELNINIITRLAFECKSLKIVSQKIYEFKNLEEKLYNENGIAVQFSNSYSKSLKKSEIIINLDFTEQLINEYEINKNAIIINTERKIKIKSKMFNGVLINSISIRLPQNIKKIKYINEFNNLLIYESLIENNLQNANVKILKLIGLNGYIEKREFII